MFKLLSYMDGCSVGPERTFRGLVPYQGSARVEKRGSTGDSHQVRQRSSKSRKFAVCGVVVRIKV